jgi:hypothetical protein
MAEFRHFPEQIRKTALENIQPDEEVKMCFIAGTSINSSKDYVIVTSQRVLVLDERTIGYLGKYYVNVKENVPINQIYSIDITRSFINRLLGQASMGLQIDRYKYLINNGNIGDIRKAEKLIKELIQEQAK